MKKRECPNCGEHVASHPENGCVLAAFVGVLRDRGMAERKARDLHATCDASALWDAVAPVVDDLEKGRFS